MKYLKIFILFLLGITSVTFADNVRHIVWDKTPIKIVLSVGKERIVSFPGQVQFGYDKIALSSDKLRVQNNDGTLYLLAKETFDPERVEIRITDSGKIVLLDICAKKSADNTPLDIVLPQDNNQPSQNNKPSQKPVDTVVLTRFAVQQLYAPKRLLTAPSNIYRVPMHTTRTVPLILSGGITAMALASWSGGDLTVTAVLLRNMTPREAILDPRRLCGNWVSTAFFPANKLTKAGTRNDTTTVFLVSQGDFADAIDTCKGAAS